MPTTDMIHTTETTRAISPSTPLMTRSTRRVFHRLTRNPNYRSCRAERYRALYAALGAVWTV
jgi:hypothetical protein